jgi:hypothetical protein
MKGGNLPVTFPATPTISSNAGRSIDIQNRTGGTVTFTGPITDTDTGIFLNANTGSAFNSTGGLSLSTGTSPGFSATALRLTRADRARVAEELFSSLTFSLPAGRPHEPRS